MIIKVCFLIGLGIIILLVGWQGAATIADRFADLGLWGIFLVSLFILPDLLLRTASFHLLFAPGRNPRFANSFFAMWIGSSVNFLLPVATLGGEFVKARILTLRGVRGLDAAASVVLDKTVQALSVLLWTLVGIVILVIVAPPDEPLVTASIVGTALLALGIAGFIAVQLAGSFGLMSRPAAKLLRSEKWRTLIEGAADLDTAIRDLYRRPGAITASTGFRIVKRVLMAGQVWLIAWLVGYPIGPAEAIMVNSLAVALRSAAFAIPGGLGVQEGGYIIMVALVGLPPDVMLTISLATRLGELVEGLPGLVAWQVAEGKLNWSRTG